MLVDDSVSSSSRRKTTRKIIRAVDTDSTPIEEPAFITTIMDKFAIQNDSSVVSEHVSASFVID